MRERVELVENNHPKLSMRKQCELLGVARSTVSYQAVTENPEDIRIKRLLDEINDRHYLIVDALDGRTHYVDIGNGEATEPMPEGAIVCIDPKRPESRQVDRTVSEIA